MASSLLSALLSRSLTAVWISGEVMVDLLLWWVILLSLAKILSSRSLTKEIMMLMALEDTPVSGCTCFRTLYIERA